MRLPLPTYKFKLNHEQQQSKIREFRVTIKIKLWNILLILLSLAVVCTFIAYVMTENSIC